MADLAGWRAAFFTVALVTLAAAVMVTIMLPRETRFVRSEGLAASGRQMLRHLRNPKLLATYAVGFGVLFNFIATFTYVSFHLAAPPYSFSSTLLGSIFVTYLVGSMVVPFVGRADRAVRTAALHARRHRGVDRRRPADAGAAGRGHHRRPDAVRGLRHAVPGGVDRLCGC